MNKIAVGDAELANLARMLHKVDFFAPLTVGQLEKVLPYVLLYSYEAGESVFKQGEIGDAFFIVESGEVEVWVKKGWFSSGKLVATLGPGTFFGEMALISREKRNATVKCSAPSRVFALVAADFQFVLKENPQASAEMARIAERRKFDSSHKTGS
jgi:CRP-like cAMP-binding protein